MPTVPKPPPGNPDAAETYLDAVLQKRPDLDADEIRAQVDAWGVSRDRANLAVGVAEQLDWSWSWEDVKAQFPEA